MENLDVKNSPDYFNEKMTTSYYILVIINRFEALNITNVNYLGLI